MAVHQAVEHGVGNGGVTDPRMPVLNGRGQGDLVVQIDVETPAKLNARQRELLEELRQLETGDTATSDDGFFGRLKDIWNS